VDSALTAARILVQSIVTDHADIGNNEQLQSNFARAAISQLQRRHSGWGAAHRPIRR
jgi:hypothetical protein